MRNRSMLFLVAVVCLVALATAVAQEKALPRSEPKPEAKAVAKPEPEPQNKLVEFHMALLKHGPKWTAAESPETTRMHQQHVEYVMSLLNSGKAILAGPFTDGGEIARSVSFRGEPERAIMGSATAFVVAGALLSDALRGILKTLWETIQPKRRPIQNGKVSAVSSSKKREIHLLS